MEMLAPRTGLSRYRSPCLWGAGYGLGLVCALRNDMMGNGRDGEIR